MDLVTLDFESTYGSDYTLSSMTTEAYVRDPRFEAILCSFQVNDERPYWVPRDDIPAVLRDLRLDKRAVLMHHAHFDSLILNHHYGVRPRLNLCTLGMARALHGANGGLSLAKLCERYGIGAKGDEVHNVKGMRLADFTPDGLARYGRYGCNDVAKTYLLGLAMLPQFSRTELKIHDQVIRMFTEPLLLLDQDLLRRYRDQLAAEKAQLLFEAGVNKDDLMSNDKFAALLLERGIEPPLKVSPTWLKKSVEERSPEPVYTYAFAKTDKAMQELQEHDDPEVQALVEARLKNKTTIAEKGAERLIGMAGRGPATVYLKYSGASGTHRLSGGDSFNWQSMKRGSDLRNAVLAPPGHQVVVADSSTIEARILDWLAGQEDMVEVYRKQDAKTGPDMYCTIAERVYGRAIDKKKDPDERQLGKTTKLGLGFGMGADKFVSAVRAQAKERVRGINGEWIPDTGTASGYKEKPMIITREFSGFVVDMYRNTHTQVGKLWRRFGAALEAISRGQIGMAVDYRGVIKTCRDGLILPGGLRILYPELRKVASEPGSPFPFEWEFWNGKMCERIYAQKSCENGIQALARIVVFEQCLAAAEECQDAARWAHSVHDEGVFVASDFDAPWVLERLMHHMRQPPSWAPDLPVNCEGGFHQRYGQAKG